VSYLKTSQYDLCRTKKTTETIYKSVDDVWSEAEETSKKVSQPVFVKDDCLILTNVSYSYLCFFMLINLWGQFVF
jgi:hypothetical protein